MTLTEDFVLGQVTVRASAAQGATPDQQSIVDAHCFQRMLAVLHNDIDFGPFVATAETPDAQLANRRWLRTVFLVSQFRPTKQAFMDGLMWLDRPNESLDWMSPFDATADDEAFARANALVFLTGGTQIEPDTIESELFADFCASFTVLPEALRSDPDSPLVRTLAALQQSSGSLATARLMLTCASVSGERSATLYRLVRECDAATIDDILRRQFGYTGKELDR